MQQVIKSAAANPDSTMDRATKRAVGNAVNAAIHNLQLADEDTCDGEVVRARGHFKAARDAIDEAVRQLKP